MDGSCVDFAVVSGTLQGQPPLYKGVGRIKMGPDITRRYFMAIFLDTEWDKGGSSVVFKTRRRWGYESPSCSVAWRLLRVRGASSIRYRPGSTTSSLTLVLTSSTSYTQPFGSDGGVNPKSFCDDVSELPAIVIGWRNRSGIFVVFKGIEDASCQRCGLHTIEVKPLCYGWSAVVCDVHVVG
jgi:hypothetical protein